MYSLYILLAIEASLAAALGPIRVPAPIDNLPLVPRVGGDSQTTSSIIRPFRAQAPPSKTTTTTTTSKPKTTTTKPKSSTSTTKSNSKTTTIIPKTSKSSTTSRSTTSTKTSSKISPTPSTERAALAPPTSTPKPSLTTTKPKSSSTTSTTPKSSSASSKAPSSTLISAPSSGFATSTRKPSGTVTASASSTAKPTIVYVSNGFVQFGCYAAAPETWGAQMTSSSMTVDSCTKFCAYSGYPKFSQITNGNTCGCTYDNPSQSRKAADSSCNVGCSGNGSQLCGGKAYSQMYQSG